MGRHLRGEVPSVNVNLENWPASRRTLLGGRQGGGAIPEKEANRGSSKKSELKTTRGRAAQPIYEKNNRG